MARPIVTTIASKYLVAVPPPIRDVFDLRVGDLFEWLLNEASGEIRLIPKRAELITPRVRERVQEMRQKKEDPVAEPSRTRLAESR